MSAPLAYSCMPRPRLEAGPLWIEAVQPGDIESIRRWRNAQIDILRQKSELSPEQQASYYAKHIWPAMAETQPANILVSYHEGSRLIGYGGLVHIAWEHARAEVSFLLDPALMASSAFYAPYIHAFLDLMKRLAFIDLGFSRLVTEAYAIRTDIIALLEQSGFVREGVLRRHVIIDGRPVDALMHGFIKDETSIVLSPAGDDDCERLWKWRNDSVTRANSLTSGEVAWETHQSWYAKALGDPARAIYIGRIGGEPVGMCRFDIAAEGTKAEVSIVLDPLARGKGLSQPLLSAAVAVFGRLHRIPVLATVKAKNRASARCFEKCGFVLTGEEDSLRRYRYDFS